MTHRISHERKSGAMAKLFSENGQVPYTELQDTETEAPPLLSKPRTLLMNFTQFGLNFLVLLLNVVVIPAQVEALVESSSKGSALGGLMAGGAVVTFTMSPVIGMVSDRLRTKMGRRRPLMIVGALLACIGLLGMAFSSPTLEVDTEQTTSTTGSSPANDDENCHRDLVAKRCQPYRDTNVTSEDIAISNSSGYLGGGLSATIPPDYSSTGAVVGDDRSGNLGLYILFFLIVVAAQVLIAVPFNALVADKSHPSQRGFNSGVMGSMILLGSVAGSVGGIAFTNIGVLSTYGLIIIILISCVCITAISTSECQARQDTEKTPLGCRVVFAGFWSPLKEHDFRWVFLTRFLMQQGVATIIGFLEYWLDDMIQLPYCWTASTAVAVVLLPLLFSAAFSSVIFGVVSDRTGKRKIIVAVAAFLMGAVAVVNAFLSGDSAYYVALGLSFVYGLGYGAYLAVDFALVMDVLMDEKEKAKDIAVWHQALVLPQALATPIGGLILDLFERVNCELGLGYIMLFSITAVYLFLSGIFVFKIRRTQ